MVSYELLRQLPKGRGVNLVLRLQAWSEPSHLDHDTSIYIRTYKQEEQRKETELYDRHRIRIERSSSLSLTTSRNPRQVTREI